MIETLEPVAMSAADVIWMTAAARDVVAAEAAALNRLADDLDGSFAQAVGLLAMTRGRVVLSGIGKSGHVARKIAATLASTDLPAIFLHPAEAAHGDLGMIARGDTLLLLSKSGTTRELWPIVARATLLGAPVIAISADADSPLMREATVRLVLPNVDEACPGRLAPTTSTAMMMALGDALAIVAMRVRGVSGAGFGALHPGGAIGERLLRVTALMRPRSTIPLVAPDAAMMDVIVQITAAGCGIAGVVDPDGTLIGVITDGDLRRHLADLPRASAADVMTPRPVTVLDTSLAGDALALMKRHKITAVFVMDAADPRRPVGIAHVHNFLGSGLS